MSSYTRRVLNAVGLALHRVMLRTEPRLRPLWRAAHKLVLRASMIYLRRGKSGSGAYLRASFGYGDALYGLSDIDMIVVLPDQSPGHACPHARRRWRRLCRVVPGLGHLVQPTIYEETELGRAIASSTLTADRAVHLGSRPDCDEASLRFRPGLYGPMRDWRHLAGADCRPPALPLQDEHQRRIAAWLELQRWWREAFYACAHPGGPRLPYLCVKLVAEPVRIWLWLVYGEQQHRREDVLLRALRRMPEEEQALTGALSLYRALSRSPEPPLAEMLTAFVRLSGRLGRLLVDELRDADTTTVRLLWGGQQELLVDADGRRRMHKLTGQDPILLPLADWRARVWPVHPDDVLAEAHLDPADPAELGAAAVAAGDWGPYPAVRTDGLLVLPGPGLMRAVQCAATDPVSFAVLDRAATAAFPDVPGWSAGDSARRAVAEHRAWLGADLPGRLTALDEWMDAQAHTTVPAAEALGRLLTAGQAALFLNSLEAGDPELPLTLAAAAGQLGETVPGGRDLVDEAYGHYRIGRRRDGTVPDRLVARLRGLILSLPAYAFASPWPAHEWSHRRLRS